MPVVSGVSPHVGVRWRARVLACWLALLVVWGPTLERLHGVLHLPPARGAVASAALAPGHGSEQFVGTGLAALFSHHGALDCWALEQLGHGQAGSFLVWQPPAPCPQAAPAWQPHGAPVVAALRLFQARAPPVRFMA